MAQESFIKKLLDKQVPQICGSYLVAATSFLKVVEVTESKVVAKLLELKRTWGKIREGDKITP